MTPLTRIEVSDAFNNGQVDLKTDDELLEKLLFTICTKRSDNDANHPRDIARALYINHIKMVRFMSKLSSKSTIWTCVATLIGAAIGALLTLSSPLFLEWLTKK